MPLGDASDFASSGAAHHNSDVLSGTGLLEPLEPPGLQPKFPRSSSMPDTSRAPLTQQVFGDRQRSNTNDDLDKPESKPHSSLPSHLPILRGSRVSAPILARQRSSPLDIQSTDHFRRVRPAPPKSRRYSGDKSSFKKDEATGRHSSEELSPVPSSPMSSPLFQSLGEMAEEDQFINLISPTALQDSVRSQENESPAFGNIPHNQTLSPLFQPTSPSLDNAAFQTMPTSPPTAAPFGHDRTSSDFRPDGLGPLHSRPMSTISHGSETAMSEMIQHLQQELARKAQELDAHRADGYTALLEKEALLEEVRTELMTKRREEKELRSKEKINLSQIATLESTTATFRDDRDKQKAAYQNTRKQYEEQCGVLRARFICSVFTDSRLQLSQRNFAI